MFENITTLAELNKERFRLASEGKFPLVEINSEFQNKRKELRDCVNKFIQVKIIRPDVVEHQPFVLIPYAGESEKELTISFIPNRGFTV